VKIQFSFNIQQDNLPLLKKPIGDKWIETIERVTIKSIVFSFTQDV